jgi:hypothetical protein
VNLKSAQIKRVYYNVDPGGKDLIVLSDYDDEVRRIRAEALKDAADRAVEFVMTATAVIPSQLRAAIYAGEVKE